MHTPGPWRLGPIHKDGSYAIHAEGCSIVHCKPFSSSHKSWEDNARLLAAAPALAATLKDAIQVLDMMAATDSDPRYRKILKAAKAALDSIA